jgi:TRAP-type transport system small permease protein
MIIYKALDKFIHSLLILSSLAGFSIVSIVLWSVFQRYVLKSPLSFSEELVGLFLSSMLFLSLPFINSSDKNVKINLVTNIVQVEYRPWLLIIAHSISIIFCSWMLIEAIDWMEFAIRLNLKTENSRIMLSPWMAILPLSFFMSILVSVRKIYRLILS